MSNASAAVSGIGLVVGAIGDVARNWRVALRILVVPLAAYLVAEIAFSLQETRYLNDATGVVFSWGTVLEFVAFCLFIGVLAVSWHRFMLTQEPPGAFGPRIHVRLWAKYAVRWFFLGLVITLIMAVCVVLPLYVLFWLLVPEVGWQMTGALFPDPMVAEAPAAWALPAALIAVTAVLVIYLYLVFRMSLGLPVLAVAEDDDWSMADSVAQTRALARPLWVAALVAGLGQMVLAYLPEFFVLSDPAWNDFEIAFSFQYQYRDAALTMLVDSVNALIAAAILTRIYRALPEEAA